MDLSVVIVSFNTADLLRRCLKSVLESTALIPDFEAEVWVVDNNSHDGSAAMVASEFPQAHLIANHENRGFAAANNQALSVATGRYVLLLNPDTEVRGDAIGEMVRYLDAHPNVALVGGRLVYPDGSFQHSCFRFPTLLMTFFDYFPINHRLADSRLNGRYPRASYAQPFAVDHPLGAVMLVRSDVLRQVGVFDERFFIYCEEIDLCLRIKKAGWQIHCVPSAEVVHHSAKSTSQFRGPMLIELNRSRYALFDKHYGKVYQWVNRRLVRYATRRQLAAVKRALATGAITPDEADEHLRVYTTIARM